MSEILFTATSQERETIKKITERLEKDCPSLDRLSFVMDLEACHSNGTPLNFDKLLVFPQFDFLHDCYGIIDHMNRKTGKLQDFFLPRSAKA